MCVLCLKDLSLNLEIQMWKICDLMYGIDGVSKIIPQQILLDSGCMPQIAMEKYMRIEEAV